MFRGMKELGMNFKFVAAPIASAVVVAATPITSLAADTSTFDVTAVLGAAFDSIVSTMLGTIALAVPAALLVIGSVTAIKFGIRFFKSLAK